MAIGKLELILIIVGVLLIMFYGAKKLPELARGIGQSAGELKKGLKEGMAEDEKKNGEKATTDKKE
jgi:sec-independent protein translocase protein TatA